MALPALPPDGLNPWGAALRSALTDISNRADAGITDADDALTDLEDVHDELDSHAASLATNTAAIATANTNIATKAADNAVVKLTGNQTVAGTKTFSAAPVVPDNSFAIAKVNGLQTALNAKANANNPAFTGTVTGIDKATVGLANVNNTTDADKPVSTATQAALNSKANTTDLTTAIQTHNHSGGANGVAIPISGVTGLQTSLNAKQNTLAQANAGSSQIDIETADWIVNYCGLARSGAVAYLTLKITRKGASSGGNHANVKIGTFKSTSLYRNMYVGLTSGDYSGMIYALGSAADGVVASGYIHSATGEIVLSANAANEALGNSYTFSLSGTFLLNTAE